MIRDPWLLAALLGGIVAFVFWARGRPGFQWAFRFLPVPFWCYFLPMAAGAFGLLPAESPLYGGVSKYVLPACLCLLLINVSLPALASLGGRAISIMAVGAAGVMIGAVVSFFVFHRALPPESWRAVGALSGSWVGGSANMLGLKEALSAPESVFAPVVVVDTFLAYAWMAFLISLAGFQSRFDAWSRADGRLLEKLTAVPPPIARAGFSAPWAVIPLVSVGVGVAGIFLGNFLPPVGAVISQKTWTILIVTTGALVVSLTGAFGAAPDRTERWGTTALYFLLATVGAQGKLSAVFEVPQFLLMGVLWLLIHGAVLFVTARALKAPLSLVATASQACVGGVVSSPMVAATYRPALAPVGLLLAVLGNVAGTYTGLVTAAICRWIAEGR